MNIITITEPNLENQFKKQQLSQKDQPKKILGQIRLVYKPLLGSIQGPI